MAKPNDNGRNETTGRSGRDRRSDREQDVNPAAQGHQGDTDGAQMSRSGVDRRNDGRSPQNGGGDGAGGAPRVQGQGQANRGERPDHQNRGHGGH